MTDHWYKLNFVDQDRIRFAARPLGPWGADNAAHRYNFYRKKGYTVTEAVRYTLAWCRNMAAQQAGRKGHGTGAI